MNRTEWQRKRARVATSPRRERGATTDLDRTNRATPQPQRPRRATYVIRSFSLRKGQKEFLDALVTTLRGAGLSTSRSHVVQCAIQRFDAEHGHLTGADLLRAVLGL